MARGMPVVMREALRHPAAGRLLPLQPAIAGDPSLLWVQGCCFVLCSLLEDLHDQLPPHCAHSTGSQTFICIWYLTDQKGYHYLHHAQ